MCVTVCPEDALSCFGLAEVHDNCNGCLTCIEYCPSGALTECNDGEDLHDRPDR